jgi:hypothetical protein
MRSRRECVREFSLADCQSPLKCSGPSPSRSIWRRRAIALLLVFSVLVFVHQQRFDRATPVSRLNSLHAILSEQNLVVDRWATNTSDLAYANGHYYSDKAPGTLVLALPGFAAGSMLLRARGTDLESRSGWLLTSWTACAGLALITALGLLALANLLRSMTASSAGTLTAAAVWFGAAPLPYSTLLFSHTQVVACIALGLRLLQRAEPAFFGSAHPCVPTNSRSRVLALAGFMFGWALNSEYTAGLVVLGILAAVVGWKWRDYAWIGAGMTGPLLLIPLYSWLTIGSPFVLPYSYQASFPEMKERLYAIKWPDPTTAWNLLFSPERGLFFWSPFLLCAFLGYPSLLRRSPRLFWLTYAVPILQVVVISGRVWDWPAGPTLGPRYLAPILPLLAIPCAFGAQRFPKLALLLGGYSILITTIATLTDACPAYPAHPNPLRDLHIPMLLSGQFSPNLGTVLGLPPYASLALFYALLLAAVWCLCGRSPKESQPVFCADHR